MTHEAAVPTVLPTDPPTGECDLAVVGAGILGLAVAREMTARHPELSVRVLEKEDEVGFHQTGHNSGVVHAGIYYKPGSLKAELCVSGARELYAYCEERGVNAARLGKLIVATSAAELPRLEELERRGSANGVPGLRRLSGAEIPDVEPHARGVAALHSPDTGVVDFTEVARAFAEDVRAAGATVSTGCAVTGLDRRGGRTHLRHECGELRARHVVFCAGGWADRLARASGAPEDPRIVPFRGAWLRLAPERRHLVRGMIYPVPDPSLPFLGVHLTRHTDGEVLVGPTALLAGARDAYALRHVRGADLRATLTWPGSWRMARRWWRHGLTEMRHAASPRAFMAEAARYVPELRPGDARPGPSGVRAQALGRDGTLIDDFVFSETDGALHVRNAPSPAATASLAIARLIADRADAAFTLRR